MLNGLLHKFAHYIITKPRNKVSIEVINADYHKILDKKKVVITGGARGIGRAITNKLVKEGAKTLITGHNEGRLKKAAEEVGGLYLVCDNETIQDYDGFIKSCVSSLGGIDCIVLNAGVSLHEGNFLNVTPNGFDKQFKVNLRANYFIAQSFIKYKLSKKEGGSLLFISSETGGKSNDLPYGLTKNALNSLVRGIARRVYLSGLRVNAIAPGITYTDMTNNAKDRKGDYSNSNVAGRYLLPEEIAEIACFILSDISKCINGEIIYCDAGSHLKINGNEFFYSL